jgi:hypothetical protein
MKKFLIGVPLLVMVLAVSVGAYIKPPSGGVVVESPDAVLPIMYNQTGIRAADAFTLHPEQRTFQATVTGTGAVTATVRIQVSNDKTTWIDSTTTPHVALSGTTTATDGYNMNAKWAYVRAVLDAISGTGATVSVFMGV